MNFFLPNPMMDGKKNEAQDSKNDLSGRRLARLSIAALGVVFGDIGTSPLYAIRECFHGEYGIAVSPANVLGVLSLMFWSLVMIVTFKYLIFVFRADNQGEGGGMVLTALIKSATGQMKKTRMPLVSIGLVLGFQSSSKLAAAYGVAVTSTMLVTTTLFYVVARQRWGWRRLTAGALAGIFFLVDIPFFGANCGRRKLRRKVKLKMDLQSIIENYG